MLTLAVLVALPPANAKPYQFHHTFKVGDVVAYRCTSASLDKNDPSPVVVMTAKEKVVKTFPDGGAMVEYTLGGFTTRGSDRLTFPEKVESMRVSKTGSPNEQSDQNSIRVSLFGVIQEPLAALKRAYKVGQAGTYESVDPPLTNVHQKGTLRLVGVDHGLAHFALAGEVFIGGTQKLNSSTGDYWIDTKTAVVKRAVMNIVEEKPQTGKFIVTVERAK